MARLSTVSIIAMGLASLAFNAGAQPSSGTDLSLLPKYGEGPKGEALRETDARFLAEMDARYEGDRRKASQAASTRGWQHFAQGEHDVAMRRFNQAWLLDSSNGVALWGMGAVLSYKTQHRGALKLFSEANTTLSSNARFSVDYARAIGFAGTALHDEKLTADALARFSAIHAESPENTINLQNWAMTLYFDEKFDAAWQKIQLAQATPNARLLSNEFVEKVRQKVAAPR